MAKAQNRHLDKHGKKQGHWITTDDDQHVYISGKGEFLPRGPGTKPPSRHGAPQSAAGKARTAELVAKARAANQAKPATPTLREQAAAHRAGIDPAMRSQLASRFKESRGKMPQAMEMQAKADPERRRRTLAAVEEKLGHFEQRTKGIPAASPVEAKTNNQFIKTTRAFVRNLKRMGGIAPSPNPTAGRADFIASHGSPRPAASPIPAPRGAVTSESINRAPRQSPEVGSRMASIESRARKMDTRGSKERQELARKLRTIVSAALPDAAKAYGGVVNKYPGRNIGAGEGIAVKTGSGMWTVLTRKEAARAYRSRAGAGR